MKKSIVIISALLLTQITLYAQSSDNKTTGNATPITIKVDSPTIEKVSIGVSKIVFKETVHDFGDVKQNNPATSVFEFTNNTDKTLTIETAQASCGCTTPDWTKEPIEIGKNGKITATYNAAAAGGFTKTITVKFSNGTMEYLTIKGNVIANPNIPNTPAIKVNTPN